MKTNNWLLRHGIFWLIYFSVNLFNELYLSVSFSAHPSSDLFFDSVLSQLLVLLIKVPAVYYILYSLIPRWFKAPSKQWLLTECIVVLVLFLLAYRFMIQYVVWPFIFYEKQTLTGLQLTARYFYSFMDLLQVTGIAATLKLFRMRIAAMKKENTLVREKHQSEMRHLKSQINPHFLFNTLNSIYALSRAQADDTPDSIMRLSKILRYILYETRKDTIALEEELKIINDYINLQQLRFGTNVRIQMETDIAPGSGQVAPLLILPLVENAFKHGTAAPDALITIRVGLKSNQLEVYIANPVAEIPVKQPDDEGIGLSNISRQLELLYRDYHFTFGQEDSRFVVRLHINLDSYAGFELFDSRR